MQTDEVVSLYLNGDGLADFELAIPDLSGEAFELQITERRLSRHHDELVQKSTGVMLFIHPDDVKKGTRISIGDEVAVSIGAAAHRPTDEGASGLVPWSVEGLPTQVKLVELLQFILERVSRRLRVAVIISAWDLIESQPFGPIEIVSRHLPLLHQFLTANIDLLEPHVFGISAQGGDITQDNDKNALLEINALERIRVREGISESHDITRPLAWLLGAK
jgi:hypothetical protein